MSDMRYDAIRVKPGQELPVALALLSLTRQGVHPGMRPADLAEALLFIDSAKAAIEQLVDRLEPETGVDVYARAARFMNRFEQALRIRQRQRDDRSREE